MANGDKRKVRKGAKKMAESIGEGSMEGMASYLAGKKMGGSLKRNRSLKKAEKIHDGGLLPEVEVRYSPLKANGGPGDKKKTSSVAGQDITESGHMDVNYEDGPSEGDLIRGEHLKRDKDGFIEDLDYNLQFEKDTSDVHGPYKIWKTTGIK